MRDDLEQLCAAQAEKYGQGPLEMRLEIQGLVRSAQITPEDAEDWLREWPHEVPEDPFRFEPDPTKFDPLRETYWSLGMATAWVLWRSMDAVREEWEDFVTERTLWVKIDERDAFAAAPNGYVEAKGFELRVGAPKGAWYVLSFARSYPAGLVLSADECERELVGALQRGEMVAIHGRDQHVAEIPALKWAGLSPFTPGRKALPDAVYARGEHRPAYSDVKVRRDAVMRLWGPNGNTVQSVPEAVPSQARPLMPRISGEALQSLMANPALPKDTTMKAFVNEARKRASAIGRSIALKEVRDLYRSSLGRKPRGRKSHSINSVR